MKNICSLFLIFILLIGCEKFENAKTQYEKGNYQEAIKKFEESKENIKSYFYLIEIYSNENDKINTYKTLNELFEKFKLDEIFLARNELKLIKNGEKLSNNLFTRLDILDRKKLMEISKFLLDKQKKNIDYETAINCLKLAYSRGEKLAAPLLATYLFLSSEYGYPLNFSEIRKYTEITKSNGYFKEFPQFNLFYGLILAYGLGREKNLYLAEKFLKEKTKDEDLTNLMKNQLYEVYILNGDIEKAKLLKDENKKINEIDKKIEIVYEITNRIKGKNKIFFYAPQKNNQYSDITSIKSEKVPLKKYLRKTKAIYEYELNNFNEVFKIDVLVKNYKRNYNSLAYNNYSLSLPLDKYISKEPFIETDDEEINKMAKMLKGYNEISTISNIYNFLNTQIQEDYSVINRMGAKWTLQNRRGHCTEVRDLFIALARANNIPAKGIGGLVEKSKGDIRFHVWVEVFLKGYGWVMFDAALGNNGFMPEWKNIYIYAGELDNLDTVYGIDSESNINFDFKVNYFNYK